MTAIKIHIQEQENLIIKRLAQHDEPLRVVLNMDDFENKCREAKVLKRVRFLFLQIGLQLSRDLGIFVLVNPSSYFAMKQKMVS